MTGVHFTAGQKHCLT